jgi:hypothetical protein
MKPFTFLAYCILATLTLFSTACHKDTPTNYGRYPLHLQATHSLEGVRLEWNNLPSSSDFRRYRIWRSNTSDTIPDNLEITTGANGLSNIVKIDSTSDVTNKVAFDRLTELSFLQNNQTEVYYRVEVVLRNRSVLSPNIKIQAFSGLVIPSYGKGVQAISNATNDLLYVFSEDKVLVFDSKSEVFIKTIALPSTFVFSSDYALLLGKENGEDVIYVGNGTALSVLRASDLSEIETISFADFFGGSIAHISLDDKGLLYISNDGFVGALFTLNRKAANEIIHYSNINTNGSNWVYEYSPSAKKIIGFKYNSAIGAQRIAYMKLSPVAKTVEYDNSLAIASTIQNTFIAPPFRFLFYDDGRLIVDKTGLQFNADLTKYESVFEDALSQGTYAGQKYLDNDYLYVTSNKLLVAYGGLNKKTILKKLTVLPQDIFPMQDKIWLITNVKSSFGVNVNFMEKIVF